MNWVLRDGQNIHVWEDHWIPGGPLRSYIHDPFLPNEEQMSVSSLRDNNIWRLENLQFPIPTHIEQLIHGILVAQLARLSDTFIWPQNNSVYLV